MYVHMYLVFNSVQNLFIYDFPFPQTLIGKAKLMCCFLKSHFAILLICLLIDQTTVRFFDRSCELSTSFILKKNICLLSWLANFLCTFPSTMRIFSCHLQIYSRFVLNFEWKYLFLISSEIIFKKKNKEKTCSFHTYIVYDLLTCYFNR